VQLALFLILIIEVKDDFEWYISAHSMGAVTYDHRLRRIGHPVRSAIHKPQIGRLVVGWVTTSEYLLLYVFRFIFAGSSLPRLSTSIIFFIKSIIEGVLYW
jgi:hypothetical protein